MRCTGRPWQLQQRQRPQQPAAAAVAAAYEPSTAAGTYAEYDDDSRSAAVPSSDQSLPYQEQPEQDYGEPEGLYVEPERVYSEPEQNYEVDEAVSVLSDGRVHGVQHHQPVPTTEASWSSVTSTTTASTTTSTTTTTAASGAVETRKSGYVVDGKHYRKYRVEEETPDGFIVGEYGVVSHHDGTTRGVRYTADSSINPRVIYEALAKFLALR